MKAIVQYLLGVLDFLFGMVVFVMIILIISVIFFPHDNLLLQFGKWVSTK